MVRPIKNLNSCNNITISKFINDKSSKISNLTSLNLVSCSKSSNKGKNWKEIPMNDTDKSSKGSSNTDNSHTEIGTSEEFPGTPKSFNQLKRKKEAIKKNISYKSVSKKNSIHKNNASPLSENILPVAMFPSNAIIIKVGELPKIIESKDIPIMSMKSEQTDVGSVSSSLLNKQNVITVQKNQVSTNKTLNLTKYFPIKPKIAKSITSTYNKPIVKTLSYDNDQKKIGSVVQTVGYDDSSPIKIEPIVKKVRYDNGQIKIVDVQNLSEQIKDKNRYIEPSIQQKSNCENIELNVQRNNIHEINYLSVQSKALCENIQPNIVKLHKSKNIEPSISLKEQTVSSGSSFEQKEETYSNEILNITKYVPIKPKSPDYQDPKILNVPPCKLKQNCRESKVLAYKCEICQKRFCRPYNLLHHLRKLHLVQIETHKELECRICKKLFANHSDLFKHENYFHSGLLPKSGFYYKCLKCLLDFQDVNSIKNHTVNDHSNINFKSENKLIFNSYEEFEKWKESAEKDALSEFIIQGRQKFQGFEKLNYICRRRSPIPRHFEGSRKRKMKYQGSIETEIFCPAFIQAQVFETSVKVTYNLTHRGHDFDVKHIAMQKRMKSGVNYNLLCCRVCRRMFSNSNYLKKHEKSVHGLDACYKLTFKCPICFVIFPTRRRIMGHLSKLHEKTHLKKSIFTFESLKEFDKWKSSLEHETGYEYVLDIAYEKGMCSIWRFNCYYLSAHGENEHFCPSSLLVKINNLDNSVGVEFLFTHIGHSNENCQIRDEIRESHNAAEKILKNFYVIEKDNICTVCSFTDENDFFEVKPLDINSNHFCIFKCFSCNVCCHQFSCNCSALSSKLMCTHVHIVCLSEIQINEKNISENICSEVNMNYNEQYNSNETENKASQEIEEKQVCSVININYNGLEDNNELENNVSNEMKDNQVCSNVDMIHYQQANSIQLENNVLQEIKERQTLNNMKEQALSLLSPLFTNIQNCNDENKLKIVISDLSN